MLKVYYYTIQHFASCLVFILLLTSVSHFYSFTSSDRKEMGVVAVDKGGPHRQILSEFWAQLKNLSIPCFEKDSDGQICGEIIHVPMFESTTGGIVPLQDDVLRRSFPKKFRGKDGEDLLDKVAKKYYFAVGRFMLHSIATDVTIMNNVITPFFQNCEDIESILFIFTYSNFENF